MTIRVNKKKKKVVEMKMANTLAAKQLNIKSETKEYSNIALQAKI